MTDNAVMISDLSDYELDAVAAGYGGIRIKDVNVALVNAPTIAPSINFNKSKKGDVTQGSYNGAGVSIDQS